MNPHTESDSAQSDGAEFIRAELDRAELDRCESDRGDVPGWVLITMMTAGLVVMLWALAGDALAEMFQAAMARVSNVSGG